MFPTPLNVIKNGQGIPLILLHGWGWHSAIWEPLIPALSEHYQVIRIDLPGFGLSSMSSDYECETLASLIFEHVPEKAIWLGWSLGGMLAWWIAIHYPQKVQKLITIASSPRFIMDTDWPGVPLTTLDKFATALTNNPKQTLSDFLELQLRGTPNHQQLFTELNTQLKTPDPRALQGGLQLLKQLDLRPDINKTLCPSLHIFGSNDTLVPTQITQQISHPLAHCKIIPRTGHIPFLTPSFTDLLFLFLKNE